ncbi:MAG: serine/threonine protein kinase [Planctomycetaceae bacterium]|nr:serine/threonine protein kinase [Planctomycetaceae bacterium]
MTPPPDAENPPGDPASQSAATRFQRIQEYFWMAVDQKPLERIAWVKQQSLAPDIAAQVIAAVQADLDAGTDAAEDSAEQNAALAATITTGTAPPTDGEPTRPLPVLENYTILEEIDRGGMGIVYRARQLRPDRLVAIKMMRLGAFSSQLDVDRFLNEANAASCLTHAAVVPVYEVGEVSGEPFIVMKFIDGHTLEHTLKQQEISTDDAIRLLLVVAAAVADAHEHAIVHRDLKPSNILIDSHTASPWVLDFGLAKSLVTQSDLTSAGDIMGTPGYMSPEQARGHSDRVTPAADVYGLGAILYRILTGRPPIESRDGDFAETMQLVREHDIVPPRARNRNVPSEVDAVCMKALETDPAARYSHARAFADDLKRSLEGESTAARQTGLGRRLYRWARHCPGLAATVAIVLLFYSYHLAVVLTGLVQTGPVFQQSVNTLVPLALLNAFIWQWCLEKTSGAAWTLYAWSAGEVLLITGVISIGDGLTGGLVSTMYVLVTVSVLRCRPRLVAFVTLLSVASYSYLWIAEVRDANVAAGSVASVNDQADRANEEEMAEAITPAQAIPTILSLLLIGMIQYLALVRSSVSLEASGNQVRVRDARDRKRSPTASSG